MLMGERGGWRDVVSCDIMFYTKPSFGYGRGICFCLWVVDAQWGREGGGFFSFGDAQRLHLQARQCRQSPRRILGGLPPPSPPGSGAAAPKPPQNAGGLRGGSPSTWWLGLGSGSPPGKGRGAWGGESLPGRQHFPRCAFLLADIGSSYCDECFRAPGPRSC